MMGSMQALSVVVKKAAANNCVGSAVLNLLQSQVWRLINVIALGDLLSEFP